MFTSSLYSHCYLGFNISTTFWPLQNGSSNIFLNSANKILKVSLISDNKRLFNWFEQHSCEADCLQFVCNDNSKKNVKSHCHLLQDVLRWLQAQESSSCSVTAEPSGQISRNTHTLSSERLKMRRWWCRWRQCFMMSKGHSNAFSTFWALKKRFVRSRGSKVLSRRMGLRTHNLPYGCLKKRLWSRSSDVSRCR
jgi:hypothetical protein